MLSLEDDGDRRIKELFEEGKVTHHHSNPSRPLDLDRLGLSGRLRHGRRPVAGGHFAEVFKGELDDGSAVAVKLLKLPQYCPATDGIYKSTSSRFFRELICWSELDHPNVVELLGFTVRDGNFGFVSRWHEQGTLVDYLRSNLNASKPDLILDVAEGTHYLHTRSSPLVHGDLKAANILVNHIGVARLADFGISKQIDDVDRKTYFTTTSGVKGTMPWTAPELLQESPLSFASDVYSLAGVFLEIACPGKTPYHYMKCPLLEMPAAIIQGRIPDRNYYPEVVGHQHDALWELMCACWDKDPSKRPAITSVVEQMYWQFGLSPRVDQDVAAREPASTGHFPTKYPDAASEDIAPVSESSTQIGSHPACQTDPPRQGESLVDWMNRRYSQAYQVHLNNLPLSPSPGFYNRSNPLGSVASDDSPGTSYAPPLTIVASLGKIACPCGRTYLSRKASNKHLSDCKENGDRTSHRCDICGATFDRQDVLRVHRGLHIR